MTNKSWSNWNGTTTSNVDPAVEWVDFRPGEVVESLIKVTAMIEKFKEERKSMIQVVLCTPIGLEVIKNNTIEDVRSGGDLAPLFGIPVKVLADYAAIREETIKLDASGTKWAIVTDNGVVLSEKSFPFVDKTF